MEKNEIIDSCKAQTDPGKPWKMVFFEIKSGKSLEKKIFSLPHQGKRENQESFWTSFWNIHFKYFNFSLSGEDVASKPSNLFFYNSDD